MKFKLLKSKDNQFYFVILARNNKVIATSEMYKRKFSMNKALKVIDPETNGQRIDETLSK